MADISSCRRGRASMNDCFKSRALLCRPARPSAHCMVAQISEVRLGATCCRSTSRIHRPDLAGSAPSSGLMMEVDDGAAVRRSRLGAAGRLSSPNVTSCSKLTLATKCKRPRAILYQCDGDGTHPVQTGIPVLARWARRCPQGPKRIVGLNVTHSLARHYLSKTYRRASGTRNKGPEMM